MISLIKKIWLLLHYRTNLFRLHWWCRSRLKSDHSIACLGNPGVRWCVPLELLSSKSIVYDVGLGVDISFTRELMKKVDCQVWGFDPTPMSIEFVKKTTKNLKRFHFQPVGVWSSNKVMKFYVPTQAGFVSHSVTNLHGTADYFMASCQTLPTLAAKLRHSKIDLLKIDIEGAEYAVLTHLLKQKKLPLPKVLCVEFDQPVSFSKMTTQIAAVLSKGYHLAYQDGFNVTFIQT